MIFRWSEIFSRTQKRDDKDTTQDILLLLYLLNKAGQNITGKDTLQAKIKLMKLVFLAEYQMAKRGLKGFNFFFNIYKRGPSSMELLKLVDDLQAHGLLGFDPGSSTFSLTEEGKETIKDFTETDGKNKEFYDVIGGVVDKYGPLTPEEVLDKVYSMEIQPLYGNETVNIGEAVRDGSRKRLLMKLDQSDVKKELEVSPEWVETMNIVMGSGFPL